MTTTFEVRRDDWATSRFHDAATPDAADLAAGDVLLRIDRFALTSNNVTYAAAGDMLDYWGFFPAEPGWGRVPAMGFADVVASRHPEVAEGERVFGFFPMATELRVEASGVGASGWSDAAPHRSKHAPVYRQYTRTAADAAYAPAREDQILLLRGLFLTSFLVDDYLADHADFGARRFLISSASSKTAIALAHRLARRGAGEVVGLTSEANAAFVQGLGDCDRVVAYADAKSLAPDVPSVFVDHAGDAELVNALHHHLGGQMKRSIIVGATHWDAGGERLPDLPGAAPEFFFAPAQIQKRSAEWGAAELQRRMGEAFHGFCTAADAWLRVVRGTGRPALEQTWRLLVGGRAQPRDGHVVSLRD